jgi:formate--tetrahydrofolate ligase
MLTDLEIAQAAGILPIADIASSAGIPDENIEFYGKFKAKINPAIPIPEGKRMGKLILVTAITPTPAGEGKTTTSIGLADAMNLIGKKTIVALREPSLGPVFGVKGGAAGGGRAQVAPMEDVNLHFTGDLHAISAANNLLAAMIDNHIYQGNALGIDARKITWRRCIDMNDRQLRYVVDGLGGKANGAPREDGYDITAASEVMAALCMSDDIIDLKERLARIIIGYTYDGRPVTAGNLKAAGAMAALLKDAVKPNLVQTLEHTPVLIHGGPFANIAHGCNAVIATRLALKLADYVVTEAGFGADLGAEKFLDIKCRAAGIWPSAAVIVATVRALKLHGGAKKTDLNAKNAEAVIDGLGNLMRHVKNMRDVFHLPCVVALNRFPTDSDGEISLVQAKCGELGVRAIVSDVWAVGGAGGKALAEEVARLCEMPSEPSFCYDLSLSIVQKLDVIVKRVYGGAGVKLAPEAARQARRIKEQGLDGLPVCVAKTQYSFSDDQSKTGAPEGFYVTVRSLKVSAGAGFIVALAGDIMTIPGLPKAPAAEFIDVDADGRIAGLF